nr:MAG TPA: hypothetical protein [Caudoviricetes sp.]
MRSLGTAICFHIVQTISSLYKYRVSASIVISLQCTLFRDSRWGWST